MVEIKKAKNQPKKQNSQLKLAVVRYYKLITTAIVIGLLAFGYYFILAPKYEQVKSGGRYNLETVNKELTKRQDYLEKLKRLIAGFQKISQAEIENLKNILPPQKDIAGLFVQFQALAEENNFLLAGITINEAPQAVNIGQESGKIKKLNVSLNLIGEQTGDYQALKKFLAALEYNLRLFDVEAIYFSPDSPAYSINLFTYYYQPQ